MGTRLAATQRLAALDLLESTTLWVLGMHTDPLSLTGAVYRLVDVNPNSSTPLKIGLFENLGAIPLPSKSPVRNRLELKSSISLNILLTLLLRILELSTRTLQ